jgi:hypothetical protein
VKFAAIVATIIVLALGGIALTQGGDAKSPGVAYVTSAPPSKAECAQLQENVTSRLIDYRSAVAYDGDSDGWAAARVQAARDTLTERGCR